MRNLIIIFFFLAGIGFILYQLSKFFVGINSTRTKVERDKKLLAEALQIEYHDKLVGLDEKELKLLSIAFVEDTVMESTGKLTKGYYPSIYNEPLVAYAMKDYFNNGHFLTVARTKHDTFVFHQYENQTTVSKNDVLIGQVNKSGHLMSNNGERLASLENSKGEYNLITDGKNEQIHLRNSKNPEIGNQRAFPIVEDLDDANRELVLIMTLYDFLIQE